MKKKNTQNVIEIRQKWLEKKKMQQLKEKERKSR